MPGISISTSVRTGPTSATIRESSQAFFVGKAERGPADTAIKVQSLEEFELNYGGYVSYGYLHPVVESFFEEGGTQCYVVRVVGPAADAPGFVTFDDSSANPAITFTAVGPGAWCEDVEVKVEAGTAAGTKKVTIKYLGQTIFVTGNCSSNEEIVGKFNLNAAASRLVTASVEAGGGLVANVAYTALATSDDDVANVTDTELAAGLELFNDAYGTGIVSCPELLDESALRTALINHANTYSRIALLHTDAGETSSAAISLAQSIQGSDENLEHAALYWPWVYAPTSVPGVSRLIPPDGYVAGIRARAHNQVGPQTPYAGLISNARFLTGVETEVNATTGDALDADSVNAIRIIANKVRIYGARSLSADTDNFRYITAQDIVNHVVVESYRALEDVVFSVIDGRNGVFSNVEAKLTAVLEPLRQAGALYEAFDENGNRIDYGYTAVCDKTLNPTAQLAEGLVKAKVGLRVSSVGDRIEVNIVKSNLTGSVV